MKARDPTPERGRKVQMPKLGSRAREQAVPKETGGVSVGKMEPLIYQIA